MKEDGEKLRGFFASKFPASIFHAHLEEGGLIYSYPRVQYAVVEGVPIVTGIEEGKEAVKRLVECDTYLSLGKNKYKIREWRLETGEAEIGACREEHSYMFVTPWLPFNSKNYRKYKETKDWKEKKKLLNSILIGNILSMSKGLNQVVEKRIFVRSLLKQEEAKFKGIQFKAFKGKFKVNFKLPSLIGLGKGVSRGFGKVVEDFQEQLKY